MDILIIDDDTVFCKTLKLVLEEEHEIEYTHTLTRGSEMLRDKAYDFSGCSVAGRKRLGSTPKTEKNGFASGDYHHYRNGRP